jgi:hypothetical protein
MSASVLEPFALFPLTAFDRLFERTTFVTGWLVEGSVDAQALEAALQRVTDKWRMLAGRVQSIKEENVSIRRIEPSEFCLFTLLLTCSFPLGD